jgi:hypothetical protein
MNVGEKEQTIVAQNQEITSLSSKVSELEAIISGLKSDSNSSSSQLLDKIRGLENELQDLKAKFRTCTIQLTKV